ncbi:MAG: hypothetical protein KKA42_03810 [candidate division Zixibacteria bacterium]|nr:hypothetical protein [candidate division Zixibacteria bacterium]
MEQQPEKQNDIQSGLEKFVLERMQDGKSRSMIIDEMADTGVARGDAESAVGPVYDAISKAVRAEQWDAGSLQKAVVGGLVAAIAGGIAWAAIVVITNYEVGIVAWAMGLLCGWAVVKITGGNKGLPLQVIAMTSSLLAIFIGKYATFYYNLRQYLLDEVGADAADSISLFSSDVLAGFIDSMSELLSPYDFVFVGFALYTAWKMTRGSGIRLPQDASIPTGLPPGMGPQ